MLAGDVSLAGCCLSLRAGATCSVRRIEQRAARPDAQIRVRLTKSFLAAGVTIDGADRSGQGFSFFFPNWIAIEQVGILVFHEVDGLEEKGGVTA